MTDEVTSDSAASRREWVKPALQRFSAGGAEQTSNVQTDLGVTFS